MNNIFNDYILERLLEFRKIDPVTKCWKWTRYRILPGGYGQIRFQNKCYLVHVLSAYLCLGYELGSELDVCHKCDNPPCFNPLHLFIGDRYDNMRDASRKGRMRNGFSGITHCSQGHEFNQENTYIRPDGTGRVCKICQDSRKKEYRKREIEKYGRYFN